MSGGPAQPEAGLWLSDILDLGPSLVFGLGLGLSDLGPSLVASRVLLLALRPGVAGPVLGPSCRALGLARGLDPLSIPSLAPALSVGDPTE